MTTLSDTLQLDPATHDLMLDGSNNLAIQHASAAIAQDVASVALTYSGECWFDTSLGIPYMQVMLGQNLNPALFSSIYDAAALTVPNVVAAQTSFNALTPERKITGTVKVIDTTGQSMNAHF